MRCRQRRRALFLQIPLKGTKKFVERLRIPIARGVQNMIPPTGIAIEIPYYSSLIPLDKAAQIFHGILVKAEPESMLHAK